MSDAVFLVNNEGVKSFQSADYNTYYALAELVDNAIQANAKNIHIIGVQEYVEINTRVSRRLKEIIIYDDGNGMSRSTAKICLQLGGGTYLNAKTNLGKFGMGLPQASGSQCMRTEVYSWQKQDEILHTYLDFDELCQKNPPMLPGIITSNSLPANIDRLVSKVIRETENGSISRNHGTIICWKRCHKLNHKTYNAFFRNIEKFIGRVYRKFLSEESVRITVSGFERIRDSHYNPIPEKSFKRIRINDPMFLEKNSIVADYYHQSDAQPTNEQFGTEITSIRIDDKEYNVRIRFSHVTEEVRNTLGGGSVEPGTTPLGKLYGENQGISLMRAGRELKLDSFGFIGDISDPRNRWWGVEVEFQPDLDELFGVTFDKQEAKSFYKISREEYQDDAEESDDEGLRLMHKISEIIVTNIASMKKTIKNQTRGKRTQKSKCPTCGNIAVVENKCTSCGYRLEYCLKHTDKLLDNEGHCPICGVLPPVQEEFCTRHNRPLVSGRCKLCERERGLGPVLSSEEEKRLRIYIQDNFYNYKGNNYLLDEAISYFKNSGRNHFILYSASDSNSFVTYNRYGQIIIISLNTNHPFYEKFMAEIIEDESRDLNELVPLHLLIGALVNTELEDYQNAEMLEDYRGAFALNLRRLMRYYNFPSSRENSES